MDIFESVWNWKTQKIFWRKEGKINLKSVRTSRMFLPQFTSVYCTFVGQRRPLVRWQCSLPF